MTEIQTFDFNPSGFQRVDAHPLGHDWPVVYILEGEKEVYVGETTGAWMRFKEHYENPERRRLSKTHLVIDEEFNKSAILDIEALLIQYFAAEGTRRLQNKNKGLENHNYFDKPRYRAKLVSIWEQLQKTMRISRSMEDIENSELFKYSPYKALTEDQLTVATALFESIKKKEGVTHIVHGGPGTGKTVLAIYLVKLLQQEFGNALAVALVIPMTSLRDSLKRVFSMISGLSPDMVMGPYEVVGKKLDLVIVDEAHRLRQRKNITNYQVHDIANRRLGLGNSGTELDWVLMSSKQQVLFYDEQQSIRPADVGKEKFESLKAAKFHLKSQIRVKGGEKYIRFIDELFAGHDQLDSAFENFDFQIFDDLGEMVEEVKRKNSEFGLSRMVAGFAWEWVSNKNPALYDINIDDVHLRWNSKTSGWVNSPNAVNEVGCIHTVQGYDLNYVGVIIGPELIYETSLGRLSISKANYKDRNGWRGIADPSDLEQYIINIYKTLMTRGARGCYLYFVDKETEKFFKSRLQGVSKLVETRAPIKSPITMTMIRVPLVGSAPCGAPLLGEENIEGYIPVEKTKIKPGYDYFILRAEGDSMNLAGINNGDLVLCRTQLKAETGDRVIALLGGENVTIKEYGPREDGVRLLLPKSTNKSHTPITPDEGDIVQGVVQEVL